MAEIDPSNATDQKKKKKDLFLSFPNLNGCDYYFISTKSMFWQQVLHIFPGEFYCMVPNDARFVRL